MIRITNLPALLETDELEELLELPPETNFNDLLERETIETEAGKVHTGRGRIPIIISSKEHQEKLFQWSMWRNSESGKLVWNEVPLFMSIPRLHKCSMCEAENRIQFVGHDDRWCRIQRRTEEPEKPEEPSCQTPPNNDVQVIKQPEQAQESEIQQTREAENENQAQSTEDTEDSHASSSSSDDESRESASTVQEGEKDTWHEIRKKRKRSKKSSKSSIRGETSMTAKIPIYMSIPRLHKCAKCEAEGRQQFVGHDELWCRIVRQTTKSLEEDAQTHENVENEVQTVSQGEATHQTEAEAEEAKITENPVATETEDEDSQSSEEDDNNNHENKDTTNEGEVTNTGNKWQPAKKKKRKRSKESSKSKTTIRSTTEGPKRKSRNYNIND